MYMTAKEYLHFLLASLLDNSEAIHITETLDERGLLLSVRLDPQDVGTIIGRSGRTIDALRTMMRIFATKNTQRLSIKLLEEE